MSKKTVGVFVYALVAMTLVVGPVWAAVPLKKAPLKIFILSGQSNMTGYCGIMPLTNLANYQELEDPALRELDKRLCTAVFPSEEVIKRNNEIRAEIWDLILKTVEVDKQLKLLKKADPLPSLNEKKTKNPSEQEQQEVEKLNKQIKDMGVRKGQLQAQLQVAKGKRVYIAPDGRYGQKPGVLAFGYGRGAGFIGPEYGFGLTLEQKIDAPILLIKVAQDGASLAYDYRPPSSGAVELSEEQKKKIEELKKKQAAGEKVKIPDYSAAGKEWRSMVKFTREVLGNLQKYHPEYDPAVGYELTGFVWFQGWSDDNPEYGPHYAKNMTNMIKDLRKEFNAPNLLVVSGTPSYHRFKEKYEASLVVKAQREVGQNPEFKGNVAIVETLPFYDQQIWPLWLEWTKRPEWGMVGSHVACHYLGSGRFFVRLGDGLSTAMAEMMKQQKKPQP